MALELQNNNRSNSALAAICIVAVLLQVALAPQLSLFGGRFNFALALVVSASIGSEPRTMVYLGFAAGLVYDLTSAVPVGLMTLLLTLTAFMLSSMSRGLAPGFSLDAIRLVCVGVLAVNVLYALALFAMGIETNLLTAVGVHGLACSLLTILASIPFLLASGGPSSSSRSRARRSVNVGSSRLKRLK